MDTAVILAGGAASRFGQPKALVDVATKPMIRRVFEAVAPFAGEWIVSVADEPMADALRPVLPRVTFVVDRRRSIGPIEGIRRSAESARGDRLLVAPCDAPLLRPALYRLLLESLGPHEAAVPKLEVIDPVRAVYRTASVREILSREEIPSPSALVDRLDAHLVDRVHLERVDPDLSSFLDVNSPDDLEEAKRRLLIAKA